LALAGVTGEFEGDVKVYHPENTVPVLQPEDDWYDDDYWALLQASKNPDEFLEAIKWLAERDGMKPYPWWLIDELSIDPSAKKVGFKRCP
jgi:hypothetical protein